MRNGAEYTGRSVSDGHVVDLNLDHISMILLSYVAMHHRTENMAWNLVPVQASITLLMDISVCTQSR